MKKVVLLSNHHAYTYNFRREVIQRLVEEKYKVYVVLPYGEKVELLKEMGCEFVDLPLDRRGMNPITDLKLILGYYKIIRKIKPDAVLSYTVSKRQINPTQITLHRIYNQISGEYNSSSASFMTFLSFSSESFL